jgi:hypothetical protein
VGRVSTGEPAYFGLSTLTEAARRWLYCMRAHAHKVNSSKAVANGLANGQCSLTDSLTDWCPLSHVWTSEESWTSYTLRMHRFLVPHPTLSLASDRLLFYSISAKSPSSRSRGYVAKVTCFRRIAASRIASQESRSSGPYVFEGGKGK